MSGKNKLTSLFMLLVLCIFSFNINCKREVADKPNIVFIMADDMGYGDVSAYNPGSKIQTPHMDRIATEGLLFTNVHTPSSLCSQTILMNRRMYGINTLKKLKS